jgi:hypothetical protein
MSGLLIACASAKKCNAMVLRMLLCNGFANAIASVMQYYFNYYSILCYATQSYSHLAWGEMTD